MLLRIAMPNNSIITTHRDPTSKILKRSGFGYGPANVANAHAASTEVANRELHELPVDQTMAVRGSLAGSAGLKRTLQEPTAATYKQQKFVKIDVLDARDTDQPIRREVWL